MDEKKPIHEYIGFPPASRENLEHNTLRDPSAGSHKRTSSSSSAIESTRGVKRSRREQSNNLEDHVDIYGDHQIAKQEREDGHPQCPFSRCDADFTRVEDRDRHIKSTCHFNTLRARCPAPHCLFKGARPDIVLKHRRQDHGIDESGKCTCDARACKCARKGDMVLSLYVVRFCGTTTNKIIDKYLYTELGIDPINARYLEW